LAVLEGLPGYLTHTQGSTFPRPVWQTQWPGAGQPVNRANGMAAATPATTVRRVILGFRPAGRTEWDNIGVPPWLGHCRRPSGGVTAPPGAAPTGVRATFSSTRLDLPKEGPDATKFRKGHRHRGRKKVPRRHARGPSILGAGDARVGPPFRRRTGPTAAEGRRAAGRPRPPPRLRRPAPRLAPRRTSG